MFTNTDFFTAPFKPATIKLDNFQVGIGKRKLLLWTETSSGIDQKVTILNATQDDPLEARINSRESPSVMISFQGHPTSIFGKYLFGRRFEI